MAKPFINEYPSTIEHEMKKILVVLFLLFPLVLKLYTHPENILENFTDKQQETNNKSHYSQPWKVHEIAQDFILLDVWEYPILADSSKDQNFFFFLKMILHPPPEIINRSVSIKSWAARLLIFLRMYLGKILGLDKNINILPIPGCQEISIKERLSAEDRKRSLALSELGISDSDNKTWRIVYLYEDEMLTELSIGIVHVLMHMGWVHKSGNFFTARLAVYAKPRGMIGNLYMKLIMPFRRAIIYPALMENVRNTWEFYNKKN
jgi:hypothetical protein